MSLFWCLSVISVGKYCLKSLAENGGFGKNISGGLPYRGVVYRRVGSNLLHTMNIY